MTRYEDQSRPLSRGSSRDYGRQGQAGDPGYYGPEEHPYGQRDWGPGRQAYGPREAGLYGPRPQSSRQGGQQQQPQPNWQQGPEGPNAWQYQREQYQPPQRGTPGRWEEWPYGSDWTQSGYRGERNGGYGSGPGERGFGQPSDDDPNYQSYPDQPRTAGGAPRYGTRPPEEYRPEAGGGVGTQFEHRNYGDPYRQYTGESGQGGWAPNPPGPGVHDWHGAPGGSRTWASQYGSLAGVPQGRDPREWRAPQGPYAGKGPKGFQRPDERICEDVCQRLTDHGDIDASEMEVKVANGEVQLTGTVDSRYAKRLAEDVAETVPGVRDVQNGLRVAAEGGARKESNAQ